MEKVIFDYSKFNEADKKEKKLCKLFLSPKLKEILIKISKVPDGVLRNVVNKILTSENSGELFEITYLDVDPKGEMITFMPSQRVHRNLNFESNEDSIKQPVPDQNDEQWKSSSRQSVKIGGVLNKLFDDIFSDEAIHRFVNAYKGEVVSLTIWDRFKLVKGNDITKYYNEKSYATPPEGNLWQSCMKDKPSDYFDIYADNTEKCGMLILTDPDGKILGRAIVWFDLVKPTGKIYMDRIYSKRAEHEEMFKKYAQQQGWLYKYSQTAHDVSYMEDGQRVSKSVSVRVKPREYRKYPYMDTMKYFTPKTGRLGSDPGNAARNQETGEVFKRLRLEATDGGAQRID